MNGTKERPPGVEHEANAKRCTLRTYDHEAKKLGPECGTTMVPKTTGTRGYGIGGRVVKGVEVPEGTVVGVVEGTWYHCPHCDRYPDRTPFQVGGSS